MLVMDEISVATEIDYSSSSRLELDLSTLSQYLVSSIGELFPAKF